MSCPCLTICVGEFHIDNCKIFYLTDTRKYQGSFCNGIIEGHSFPTWKHDIERFYMISSFFLNILGRYKPETIKMNIEGYSMGSRSGMTFNIGEHTGILKLQLFLSGIQFQTIAPTEVKKFASSKGNSDKNVMYNCFLNETSLDLRKELDYTKTDISSPIGDIVDSYFICKALTRL